MSLIQTAWGGRREVHKAKSEMQPNAVEALLPLLPVLPLQQWIKINGQLGSKGDGSARFLSKLQRGCVCHSDTYICVCVSVHLLGLCMGSCVHHF